MAVVREDEMFKNAMKRMNESKEKRAVIVTGGFHADSLKKLAASKGCSYIQITPRISEVSKRDHEVYLRSILGSRDIETSQMSALLGIVDRTQRVAVTGVAATKHWARDIRGIILGMINSEPNRLGPKPIFASSIFGSPTPALATVVVRAEARQQQTITKTVAATSLRSRIAKGLMLIAVIGMMAISAKTADINAQPTSIVSDLATQIAGTDSYMSSYNAAHVSAVERLSSIREKALVPDLLKVLSSEDPSPDARKAAAIALAGIKDQSAIPELVKALHLEYGKKEIIEKRKQRLEAARAMPNDVIGLYLRYSEIEEIRCAAAYVLGEIGDRSAVPALISALSADEDVALDTDKGVHAAAAAALTKIKDRSAIPALIKLLENGDLIDRHAAVAALKEFKDRSAVPALLKALDDKRNNFGSTYGDLGYGLMDVRELVIEALGEIGDPVAAPDLVRVLSSKTGYVDTPVFAAQALGKIKDASVVPILTEMLDDHQNRDTLRGVIASVLGEIKDASAVPALIRALRDNDYFVGEKAVEALGKIKDASAAPALAEYLLDHNSAKAAEALGKIKDSSAVSTLKKILRSKPSDNSGAAFDQNADLKKAAAEALYKISKPQYFIAVHPIYSLILTGILGLASLFGIRGAVKAVKNQQSRMASGVHPRSAQYRRACKNQFPIS